MGIKLLPVLVAGALAFTSGGNEKTINTGLEYPVDVSIATADVNNDSLTDFVIASPLGVKVFYGNNKDGSWVYKDKNRFYTVKVGVDCGDYDNDGLVDIVYATAEGVRLLKNDGQAFKDAGLVYKNRDAQYVIGVDVKLKDLNNDNKLDIIYATSNAIKLLIQD